MAAGYRRPQAALRSSIACAPGELKIGENVEKLKNCIYIWQMYIAIVEVIEVKKGIYVCVSVGLRLSRYYILSHSTLV